MSTLTSSVRFGVVGTSTITENFLKAGAQVAGFQLTAIYSRTRSRAIEFSDKIGIQNVEIFTDLAALASSKCIDAVYIASPTSEHAWQSLLFLSHKKHVLCEKPACTNSVELETVLDCARKNEVAFMEAVRTLRSPNFSLLKAEVGKVGRVRQFVGTACQLSSRWPAYLRGERPNAFLPALSNGALMDLGCYAVHAAVALFGAPKAVSYTASMLETGVDGAGTLVLTYEDMVATIIISKMSQGFNRSEVQGEQSTVSVDSLLELSDVWQHSTSSAPRVLSLPPSGGVDLSARGATRWAGQMVHEVRAFIQAVNDGATEDSILSWSQSRSAMRTLDEARKCANIVYPADGRSESRL